LPRRYECQAGPPMIPSAVPQPSPARKAIVLVRCASHGARPRPSSGCLIGSHTGAVNAVVRFEPCPYFQLSAERLMQFDPLRSSVQATKQPTHRLSKAGMPCQLGFTPAGRSTPESGPPRPSAGHRP
jgi:hypothetical protein